MDESFLTQPCHYMFPEVPVGAAEKSIHKNTLRLPSSQVKPRHAGVRRSLIPALSRSERGTR
jgi:hypothetical protein